MDMIFKAMISLLDKQAEEAIDTATKETKEATKEEE